MSDGCHGAMGILPIGPHASHTSPCSVDPCDAGRYQTDRHPQVDVDDCRIPCDINSAAGQQFSRVREG